MLQPSTCCHEFMYHTPDWTEHLALHVLHLHGASGTQLYNRPFVCSGIVLSIVATHHVGTAKTSQGILFEPFFHCVSFWAWSTKMVFPDNLAGVGSAPERLLQTSHHPGKYTP